MTLSEDLKIRIIKCIKTKQYNDTEIMNIFPCDERRVDISKDTFYKLKRESFMKLRNSKRQTKLIDPIKKYIINYVTRKHNFNYKKLIHLVKKKYEVTISKSSIYNILKSNKIKKKRFIIN
jgi:transposase